MNLFRTCVIIACFLLTTLNAVLSQTTGNKSIKRTVEITFNVIVPFSTPDDDIIYLYGSMNNWDPGPNSPPDSTDLPLELVSGTTSQIKLYLEDRTRYEYKYTRGSFETVENNPDSTESANRSIFVNSETPAIIIYDTVYSWTDLTLPQEPQNVSPVLSYYNNSPQTSVAITWATTETAPSRVLYGIVGSEMNSINSTENLDMIDQGDKLIHNVTLEDLQPNTTYKYKVITDGVFESPEYSFKTAPYTDKFEFAVLGDNRPGIDTLVMESIIEDQSSFVLHLGDLVQYGLDLDNWFRFLGDYKIMLGTIPTMAIYGNHENDAYLNKFFKYPSNGSSDSTNQGHWYSLNYNNVHIIALDPYRDYEAGSEQYNWLINDLETVPGYIDLVFVMIHEPPFTSGTNHGANPVIRERLVPVFKEYDVDMIISGHEHIYERSLVDGVPYIVSGGAGSPLYFVSAGINEYSVKAESVYHYCRVYVDGKNFKVQMVRRNGTIGDEFEIINENEIVIPDKITLEQNYPNPFNPTTTIRYSLKEDYYVTLTMFDVLGREVIHLVKQNQNAGIHEVEFSASSVGRQLSTGIYFYRLTVGNRSLVKKLMVLK